jgi:hypothetical protein
LTQDFELASYTREGGIWESPGVPLKVTTPA